MGIIIIITTSHDDLSKRSYCHASFFWDIFPNVHFKWKLALAVCVEKAKTISSCEGNWLKNGSKTKLFTTVLSFSALDIHIAVCHFSG